MGRKAVLKQKQDENLVSLTKIAQAHSEDSPGYVIQSWLRSGNTLAFFLSKANLEGPLRIRDCL